MMAASFQTHLLPKSYLVVLLLLIALPHVQSAPVPLQLPSWLQEMIPEKGGSIQDEIKCYSLPYGAIGFISHILTYWTILWLSFGRKPYWPSSRLSAGKFDLCLSLIQITITVGLASFTIVRCRSRWQFILLAVWKLTMSATVGFWGIWASLRAIKNKGIAYDIVSKTEGVEDDAPKRFSVFGRSFFTLIIYFLSMAVGLVGVVSLAVENFHNPQVWKITAVFGSLVAFVGVAVLLIRACGESRNVFGAAATSVFGVVPALMLVLGAFYCDWILAALAGSLIGVPSGDTAFLYWVSVRIRGFMLTLNGECVLTSEQTYFGAKRIPLFLT
jgi:hypothetical protein